jgi:class 3 adenylate cyclase
MVSLPLGHSKLLFLYRGETVVHEHINLGFLKVSTASRTTRVLRIIRIVRLIRIVKLYKNAIIARETILQKSKESEKKLEKVASEEQSNISPVYNKLKGSKYILTLVVRRKSTLGSITKKGSILIKKKTTPRFEQKLNSNIKIDDLAKESKISKILSESITKKVIILILAMLIILPMISDDFYTNDYECSSYTFLTDYMESYKKLNLPIVNLTEFWTNVVLDGDPNYPIVNITIDNVLFYRNESWDNTDFRETEIQFSSSADGDINIIYSVLTDTTTTGIVNITKTIYVCILLTLAAVYFESDAKELVLEPLEVMIEIVENVAKDPINAKNTEQLQDGFKNTISKLSNKKQKRKEEQAEKYEVKIIQAAIVRISALLAIGFGEAGGEIIKENLSNHHDLDPMLKGKRKTAIFGFCDIRGFSLLNEILQEKTMLFVNEIAEIVHSSVDRYGGAANKNIGDAFLMVWKMNNLVERNSDVVIKYGKYGYRNSVSINYSQMADFSVISFLKVIIKINKDRRILAYRNHPGIMSNMPNYKVNMGFGLHLGWAIEGAIGSSFKIDASYLSPNVNMAARLEAATRQYGVTLLISGDLYDSISDDLKCICRHIDTVEVKGSRIPLRLFVIDVNLDLNPAKKNLLMQNQRKLKYETKKNEISALLEEIGNITNIILAKKSFQELLNTRIPKKFYRVFKKGMKYYIGGKWDKATDYFNECLSIYPNDEPTKVLLKYLKEHDYEAPSNWQGYRSLTSK